MLEHLSKWLWSDVNIRNLRTRNPMQTPINNLADMGYACNTADNNIHITHFCGNTQRTKYCIELLNTTEQLKDCSQPKQEPKCANCDQAHPACSRACPVLAKAFQEKRETLSYATVAKKSLATGTSKNSASGNSFPSFNKLKTNLSIPPQQDTAKQIQELVEQVKLLTSTVTALQVEKERLTKEVFHLQTQQTHSNQNIYQSAEFESTLWAYFQKHSALLAKALP